MKLHITVTASGGTLIISMQWHCYSWCSTTTAYSNTLTVDTKMVADVNWIVYVMDASGCISTNLVF
jgi:hypothetical protein